MYTIDKVRMAIIISMVFCVLACPATSFSEESQNAEGSQTIGGQSEGVMPAAVKNFTNIVGAEVALMNDSESSAMDTRHVTFGIDGNVEKVSDKDGNEQTYSYGRDADGNLITIMVDDKNSNCALVLSRNVIVDVKGRDGSTDGIKKIGDVGGLIIYSDPSTLQAGVVDIPTEDAKADKFGKPTAHRMTMAEPNMPALPADKPVLIVQKVDADLEKMAKDPIKIDFAAINNVIKDTQDLQQKASAEYYKKTEDYYTKVRDELKAKAKEFSEGDIKFIALMSKVGTNGTGNVIVRKAVDEVVAYLDEKKMSGTANKDVESFLRFESGLRNEVLSPERAAYDGKVKKAIENINGVIDNILTSKLALYMKVKNEKIDIIIKLPKTVDQDVVVEE